MASSTNLWPGIDVALAQDGAVHETDRGRRVTVDFYFHDPDIAYASLRRVAGARQIGAQVDPPLVLKSTDGPNSALRWFLVELAEKVRVL